MAVNKGKWTNQEVEFLRKHYLEMSPKKCAERLNRTINSIYQKAMSIGLIRQPHYTDQELKYIRLNYAHKGPTTLSREMDRSLTAIRDMAVRLGISVSFTRRSQIAKETRSKWTEESRLKKSKSQKKYRGSLSPSWKGGVCNVSEMIRGRLYSAWKKYIFQRDDYTCRLCGDRGRKLVAHHVRTFAEIRDAVIQQYPHLNTRKHTDMDKLAELVIEAHELSDGITLCQKCHKKHHLENGVNCGDLLTDGAEDNPQPSQSNIVNLVDWKVQRLTGEDAIANKPDTNAPLSIPVDR